MIEFCSKHPDVKMKPGVNRRRAKCPECNKEYQRKWWLDNKAVQIDRVKATNQRTKDLCNEYINQYLTEHPCPCGVSDIDVLEFDHIDPDAKRANVSQLVLNGCNLETVKAEIEKCRVLCANCHRKKTRQQFGYSRHKPA